MGREILKLKRIFPNDRILRKMLLVEIIEIHISKADYEYDAYDEEHQNLLKERESEAQREQRILKIHSGCKYVTITDVLQPDNDKETDFT